MTDKDKMQMLFGKEKVELDAKLIAKKRNELIIGRGRKGTNKMELLELLKYLEDLIKNANLGQYSTNKTNYSTMRYM